ncbi:class I adenylate-forming enzyme family protein [Aromatoleum toluclasticum]|uniref:class I adenylate-forming enzyme family protein n=1 Tax=Aromatoleum toluclasticum TaxID=92003 RepID=UPI00037CE265|nr:AMP-binding protein [Aromatoleum toluclasticum]
MTRHQFPRFSETYGKTWRDAGLWTDYTLHQGLDDTVARCPDRTALITTTRSYTFAEFKAESDALAAGLLGIGIGPGDIVAVQLPNWVEFCFLQIALSRIGAVIQPTHTVFREREITNLFQFCGTDAVIVADSFKDFGYADMIRGVRPQLPGLRHFIVARGEPKGADECALAALIEEGRGNLQRLEGLAPRADDVFYLNFTSGTEGNPKGFLHTHNTIMSLIRQLTGYMAADTVMLACSPMTHSFGHFTTYYCVFGGFPMVVLDRYSPGELLGMIERARVTMLSGTPAHLYGILRHPDFAKHDTSCIKSVAVGGARSSPELIAELQRTWGVKSANTYGMGETIVHTRTSPDDPDEKVRDSVGRPVFGAQLKIVDQKDRSRRLAAGEVGEICFRGPTLFVGYHNQPQKTAETRDDEGWFYTGDLGFVDADGYLCFAGRAKEVINRGGSKVYPKEIEDLLCQHPDVLDSAVVGMPDERLGERVCAYLVTRDGRDIPLAEVEAFFGQHKAMKYMYPEVLVRLDAMPMTPTGKIQKVALQQDAANRAKAAQAETVRAGQ